MEIATLGIDIGKTWFHVVGVDTSGKPVLREKLNRQSLLQFIGTCQRCLVGMEACAGAHHLARRFSGFGHDVKLIAPRFVKAYLKSNKNDFDDAAAIAEAVQRPTMRFVAVRSIEQVDLQAVHRVRDQLVCERTTVINQVRAFLLEYGLPVAVGRSQLLKQLPTVLEDAENGVSYTMRRLLSQLQERLRRIQDEVDEVADQIERAAASDARCSRLKTIPGIGPLIATALVAATGNGAQFRRARDLSAWIGLVPRQHLTCGRSRLLGISKRGNSYLRRLLVHGARSVIQNVDRGAHQFGHWLDQLEQRVHANVVVVSLANKLAWIAWAVLRHSEPYRAAAVR
jgi:transposase